MLHAALDKLATDQRKLLLENIVVCGGTSTMEGYAERLSAEVSASMTSKLLVPRLVYADAPQGALCVDWGLYPRLAEHLQRFVGHQGFIRRRRCRGASKRGVLRIKNNMIFIKIIKKKSTFMYLRFFDFLNETLGSIGGMRVPGP